MWMLSLLTLSAIATGASLALLGALLWYRHRTYPRWLREVEGAYQRGQVDGYGGREMVALHDAALAPAIFRARLAGLHHEVPRWERGR